MSLKLLIKNANQRIFPLAFAGLLAGCTKGTSDLEEWVKGEKIKSESEKIFSQTAPDIKSPERFEFDPKQLRDPFALANSEDDKEKSARASRPDPDRVKEPLEEFPLDALKMVGTIGSGSETQALIKDPTGKISRVHPNMDQGKYMGQNEGRVVAITDTKVDLEETVSDGNNGWMKRPAEIALGEGSK